MHRGYQGRIQDFKLGGGALKKIAPSRGGRENFWGISCEKSRFYAKKSYFSNFRGGGGGGGREICGVFHVKNHDFTPKKIIFLPILGGVGGGRAPGDPPPPRIRPWILTLVVINYLYYLVTENFKHKYI